MCRSGRMFAPTKVWRKWHQKINLDASQLPPPSPLPPSPPSSKPEATASPLSPKYPS
ncbi:MAG: hypothetical protein Q9198_006100 [Flavoplaca austrocitrina]